MKDILQETVCLEKGEIKRYLAEQSPKEELRRVENHLLDCPFCSDAVEGLEQYYSFDTDQSLETLKADLVNLEEVKQEETKVVRIERRSRLLTLNRVAAAVLLLLVPAASWFYLSNNSNTRSNEVVDYSVMRSGGTANEGGLKLTKIINLYDNGQYEASLAAAQNLLTENREDVKTTYYAGLSALKAEEYILAADYFMTVRLNSDFYYEKATWLEIQAQLGAKEMERAKELLDGIIERGESRYFNEARSLRAELE